MSEPKVIHRDLNRFKGCLVGGAVGDALGYAVEFCTLDEIKRAYGKKGITDYELVNGKALISDDTQMTLFTASGLLLGSTRFLVRGIMGKYSGYCGEAYEAWLETQMKPARDKSERGHFSWLKNVKQLNVCRSPGETCITALRSGKYGSIEQPINDSKGCGGVMRVAPIGLYFVDTNYTQERIDRVGADVAAITHGHELEYIPAAALVHIISLVSDVSRKIDLEEAVRESMEGVKKLFSHATHWKEFEEIMQKAVALAHANIGDEEAIGKIGKGWVAEETLAIAVYCALKYPNDFERAIVASVNHSGDSDSTGSVTGNILGAYLGYDKIPKKFLTNLELRTLIEEVATDLYEDCPFYNEYGMDDHPVWVSKYFRCDYGKDKEW